MRERNLEFYKYMDVINLIDHLILFSFFIFSFYKKLYTHI